MAPKARVLLSLTVLATTLAVPARAEIWAYRDKGGVTHYADRPVTSRYELLYRGSGMRGPISRSGGKASIGSHSASAVTRMELSTRFKAVRHLIREAASQHGLEFELLQAVIATESAFDPGAVSPQQADGVIASEVAQWQDQQLATAGRHRLGPAGVGRGPAGQHQGRALGQARPQLAL